MKDPLDNFVIALTGNFDAGDKIRSWVQNNGGKWATSITKDTTHLICSKEHFKKDMALGKSFSRPTLGENSADFTKVAAAKARPNIHIVTYDWLEDSLQARRPKREKPYLWSTIQRAKDKERRKRKAAARKLMKQDGAYPVSSSTHRLLTSPQRTPLRVAAARQRRILAAVRPSAKRSAQTPGSLHRWPL
jgi:hypothetical protein